MADTLTQGAVRRMVDCKSKDDCAGLRPVLQVIGLKTVATPGQAAANRWKAVLSDGQLFVQSMLATQLNAKAAAGELKIDSIIEVEDFMNNVIQGRTVIILLRIRILSHAGHRIGNPEDVAKVPAQAAAAAAPGNEPLYNRTNGHHAVPPGTKGNNPYGGGGASNPYGDGGANPYGGGGGGSNPYGGAPAAAAPIQRTAGASAVTPIAALNMYNNRWTIQARVTMKSDVRTWSNAKGEGSLFSVELLDSSGMDIRGTFFKEAVDKFYHFLEVGKVYSFTGGRLKVANMQWNTCKSQYEITFDQNSEIHLQSDEGTIQKQTYDFVKISDLETCEANRNVDVLAVVKTVGDPVSLVSKKSGKELQKCDLTLVDDSGVEVNLTVWGEKATQAPHEFAGQPVTAFRRARVSDYGGKSLSAGGSIEVRPDLPEAQQLQQWWTASGSTATGRSLSSSMGGAGKIESLQDRKEISAIKDENMGQVHAEKPDWLSFKATIAFLKKDKEGGAWYPACANAGEPCKNRFKVTQTTDGRWYCDKCQGTYPNPVRRWIFSGVVEDATSSTWVSFFNEQAEALFDGMTADECYNKTYMDGGWDQDGYDSVFSKAQWTEWVMKCKVKSEMVNDEPRVKTSVVSLKSVDYVQESKDMLAAIQQF
jgi:replication factor A1